MERERIQGSCTPIFKRDLAFLIAILRFQDDSNNYVCQRGAVSVMVIVIGNGIEDVTSNTGRCSLSFTRQASLNMVGQPGETIPLNSNQQQSA